MTAGQGKTEALGQSRQEAGGTVMGLKRKDPENNSNFRSGMHRPHLQGHDLKERKTAISAQIQVLTQLI